MWRLIYGLPLWIIAMPVKLVVIMLGFIAVPIAAICKAYVMTEARPVGHPKHYDGDKYNWTWKFMAPWDNWSDGIANRNYKQFDSLFWQICYWSCWRNPANGLRTWHPYSFKINPTKLGFKGSLSDPEFNTYRGRFPHWYFCWHGPYTCFFWQFKLSENHMRRLLIGWKMKPQDIQGVPEDDYRFRGAAFTTQFKQIEIR